MDRPPLKVSFPSDIAAAFCASLRENDIKYSPILVGTSQTRSGGMGFIVNSSDLQQIAIALVESKAFWGTVAAGIWAFTKRHSHKTIIIEKDGYKIKASGMSQQDLEKSLEGAQRLVLTQRDQGDGDLR